jgi:Coenzyme PQQ synthesis protein D (PqqD)
MPCVRHPVTAREVNMSNDVYRVRAPGVVSEIIDGEAVIMDLKSGKYFSADRAGGMIWQWIGEGCSRPQIAAGLCALYQGDPVSIAKAAGQFIDELVAQQLIEASTAAPTANAPPTKAGDGARKSPFVAPTLNTYTDMKDLLLLDPIHDVDEVGWPTPKAAAR